MSLMATNPKRREAETNKHYDISAEFFAGFLDPYMKYTSGLFHENESLEAGILQMLDKHIEFVIASGESPRILEIGPGWGSLLRRLIARGVDCDYTAVNPSPVQNLFIRNHITSEARIIESQFEHAEFAEASFDIVFLVGSFCHMQDKRRQLAKIHRLLKRGGRMIIEDTFFTNRAVQMEHASRSEHRYVKSLFGFAEIQPLSDFVEASASDGFRLMSALEHSASYHRTIEYWLDRLKEMRGPEAESFIKYLDIAQRGWGYTIANYLLECVKASGT